MSHRKKPTVGEQKTKEKKKNLSLLSYSTEQHEKRLERSMGLAKPQSRQQVFVYGTLLTGEHNAHRAGNARRQRAWVVGTLHDTGWGFPALTKDGKTRVTGELLSVDDEGLRSMDCLEGCPKFYRREKILVHLVGGGSVFAWVYILNELPQQATVIASGNWRERNND